MAQKARFHVAATSPGKPHVTGVRRGGWQLYALCLWIFEKSSFHSFTAIIYISPGRYYSVNTSALSTNIIGTAEGKVPPGSSQRALKKLKRLWLGIN